MGVAGDRLHGVVCEVRTLENLWNVGLGGWEMRQQAW